MAEEQTVVPGDKLKESFTAEDWTIIDKRDSKTETTADENDNQKDSSEQNEAEQTKELATELEETNLKLQEESEDLDKKEIEESDDVSVITEDSDAEKTCFDSRQVEEYDWELQNQEVPAVETVTKSEKYRRLLQDENSSSNVIIACSLVALLLGLFTGQLLELRNSKQPTASDNTHDQLKELNKVKQALEEIQASLPKKSLYPNKMSMDSVFQTRGNFEKLALAHEIIHMTIISFQNQKLLMMMDDHLDSNREEKQKKLSMMLLFRKLRAYINQFQDNSSPEKKYLESIDDKIQMVSEELIIKFTYMFIQFSIRQNERLTKLAKNICSSRNAENIFTHDMKKCCTILMGNFPKESDNRAEQQDSQIAEDMTLDEEESLVESTESTNFLDETVDKLIAMKLEQAPKSEDLILEEQVNTKSKGEAKREKNWKQQTFDNKRKSREFKNDREKSENGKNINMYDKKQNGNKKRNCKNTGEKTSCENENVSDIVMDDNVKKNEKKRVKMDTGEKYEKKENKENMDNYSWPDNGEWQLQRGKAREKLRKDSDWYFIRADSRFQARVEKDAKSENVQEEESEPRKPARNENFKKRLMKKDGPLKNSNRRHQD